MPRRRRSRLQRLSSWMRQRHQVSPGEQVRIGWQGFGRFEIPGHDQRADLKIVRVRIGRRAGEMAEAAVGIATRQSPTRSTLNSSPAIGALVSELPQREYGVKSRMTIL